jgi:hypothetical protein
MADIRVRVGQENAIKVISSVSGSAGGKSITSTNVIGGIASVTQLSVSGVSTFSNSIYYTPYSDNSFAGGVAYFGYSGILTSTRRASFASTSETNFVLSTNNEGMPAWANVIDGGEY